MLLVVSWIAGIDLRARFVACAAGFRDDGRRFQCHVGRRTCRIRISMIRQNCLGVAAGDHSGECFEMDAMASRGPLWNRMAASIVFPMMTTRIAALG
jgi:hypothetical protein